MIVLDTSIFVEYIIPFNRARHILTSEICELDNLRVSCASFLNNDTLNSKTPVPKLFIHLKPYILVK